VGRIIFGFDDDGALFKSPLLMSALYRVGILPLDGRRQIEITAHSISTFFDVYLRGAPTSDLNAHPAYSEIEYVH
jgi:hypothetical protein